MADEFERGKEAQLINIDSKENISDNSSSKEPSSNQVVEVETTKSTEIEGLDI